MYRRAYVLLSGGIDSTTCLHIADKEFSGEIVGVSINYGQRHGKEIGFAHSSTGKLLCRHVILNLQNVFPATSMLLDDSAELPNVAYKDIEGVSPTYVPFRNGLMLALLTAFAQSEFNAMPAKKPPGEWAVYFGAHKEDAANWAYPDCTPEFIGAMANAIFVGTYRSIRLHAPLGAATKAEIIRKGHELGVDWSLTWSCYKGGKNHCGICPTCRARRDGFKTAGIDDPTLYDATP